MTHHSHPPMKSSDEATEKQLEMAKEQGQAYVNALKEMANNEATSGGMKPAGDFVVAYAVEKAEGMYHLEDGELVWKEPTNENCHIEVSVRDAADDRFIPGLDVNVRVIASDGRDVGVHKQPFLWHPWLYHYGRNWEVPGDGRYTLQINIDAPQFPRHDKKNGERFADSVEVVFEDVQIKTGKK